MKTATQHLHNSLFTPEWRKQCVTIRLVYINFSQNILKRRPKLKLNKQNQKKSSEGDVCFLGLP